MKIRHLAAILALSGAVIADSAIVQDCINGCSAKCDSTTDYEAGLHWCVCDAWIHYANSGGTCYGGCRQELINTGSSVDPDTLCHQYCAGSTDFCGWNPQSCWN